MQELKLCWLYPSTSYLHGERGSFLALQKIAENLEIPCKAEIVELGEPFDPLDYDVILHSPSEESTFARVVEELTPVKDKLIKFIDEGRPLIVVGNTINLYSKHLLNNEGKLLEGLGILDTRSVGRDSVYGDDLYYLCDYNGKEFKNFGIQIQLFDLFENNEQAFGRLIYGFGNNGTSGGEGIKLKNSIFTNSLGPFLLLNPWITQEVLRVALKNRGEVLENELDFELEEKSRQAKVEFLKRKKSALDRSKLEES